MTGTFTGGFPLRQRSFRAAWRRQTPKTWRRWGLMESESQMDWRFQIKNSASNAGQRLEYVYIYIYTYIYIYVYMYTNIYFVILCSLSLYTYIQFVHILLCLFEPLGETHQISTGQSHLREGDAERLYPMFFFHHCLF